MKVRFEARFAKDLRNIKDSKLLAKVKEVIIDCQKAESLVELNHVKKLQGYDGFYRTRIGDFKSGPRGAGVGRRGAGAIAEIRRRLPRQCGAFRQGLEAALENQKGAMWPPVPSLVPVGS